MASFEELINHPNFGRMYESSYGFRYTANQILRDLPFAQNVFPTLQVGTENSDLSFSLINQPGRKITRKAGQVNSDFLADAIVEARGPVTRFRQYGPGGSTRTGAAGNRRLEFYQKEMGVEFEVSSYNMRQGSFASDQIAHMTGGKAITVVDSDTSTIVQARNLANNKYLSMEEMFRGLGINPQTDGAPFKRMKAFFNEADAEVLYRASDKRVSVSVFDATEYFSKDKKLVEQLTYMHKRTKAAMGNAAAETAQEFLADAFDKMGDGAFLMSRTGLNRTIKQMKESKRILRNELTNSGLAPNTRQYALKMKEIEDIDKKISDILRRADEGLSFNTRIFNAKNATTGKDFIFGKGETTVVSDDEYVRLHQRMNPLLSRADILSTDYMTLSLNEKIKEFKLPSGVRSTDAGMASWATMNVDPGPKTAVSNSLTTSAFGSLIDADNTYLADSLRNALKTDFDAISEGRITPGIHDLIDKLALEPLEDLTAAEMQQVRQGQEFAHRIKIFLANGGDLSKDPFMTQQLLRQVNEHYFKLAKNAKPGSMYNFGGKEVPALGGRFTMEGTSLMHLESRALTRRDDLLPDVLDVNHKRGKFGLSGSHIKAAFKAYGGFDLDDAIYGIYKYDPQTKRLLMLSLRDPNAMGEFWLSDVDITHDNNIPKYVRDVWVRHKKTIEDLKKAKKGGTGYSADEVKELVKKLNGYKSELDTYFSGRELVHKGTVYQQNFIREMNVNQVVKNGLPAANGSAWDLSRYNNESKVLSMNQLDVSNARKVASELTREYEHLQTGKLSYAPLAYRGDIYSASAGRVVPYSEYNELFNMQYPSSYVQGSIGKVTQDVVDEALRVAQENNSVLARTINQYTIIDEFVASHLDYMGENQVDPKIRAKLQELLETHKMSRIDRETLIDALVKGESGVDDVLDAAKIGMTDNMESLGRIMRGLDTFAESNNLNFKSGIDSISYQERLMRDQDQVNALTRGYGSTDYLLSDTDPKAGQSRRMRDQLKIKEEAEVRSADILKDSNEKLAYELGDNFTPAQEEKARMLINDYETAKKTARGFDQMEGALRAVESGHDDLVTAMSDMGIHIRTYAAMKDMGREDVLAIAKVLVNSGGDMSMLNQAAEIGNTGLSVADVYNRALAPQDELFDRIGGIRGGLDFEDFIEYDKGTYRYSSAAERVFDTEQRNILMADAWRRVDAERAAQPMLDMAPSKFREIGDFIQSTLGTGSSTVQLPDQLGHLSQELRQAGDKLSSEISWAGKYRTRIKRIGMADVRASKNIRSGLMIAGAFVGIGIAHRILKGDRDISAADPYPLIPDGSQYESILRNKGLDVSQSTTLGGSSMYVVRAHNIPDARALSSAIQGVLPNGKATIYKSNAYQLSNANSDSRSILQDRLG